MIYVVEEQQATWLFASLTEAQAFDNKRWDYHRYSVVMPFDQKRHAFDFNVPDCPLDFGPGQKNCRRIQRKVSQWWKARDAWWNQPYDY
jgi:hypothetical protein